MLRRKFIKVHLQRSSTKNTKNLRIIFVQDFERKGVWLFFGIFLGDILKNPLDSNLFIFDTQKLGDSKKSANDPCYFFNSQINFIYSISVIKNWIKHFLKKKSIINYYKVYINSCLKILWLWLIKYIKFGWTFVFSIIFEGSKHIWWPVYPKNIKGSYYKLEIIGSITFRKMTLVFEIELSTKI